MAIGIPIALAAASLDQQAHQAVRQRKQMKSAERAQASAQNQAETAAIRQEREAEMARAQVNQKAPDIVSLLGTEQAAANRNASSTLLSGPGGLDPSRLKIGRNSLLGE